MTSRRGGAPFVYGHKRDLTPTRHSQPSAASQTEETPDHIATDVDAVFDEFEHRRQRRVLTFYMGAAVSAIAAAVSLYWFADPDVAFWIGMSGGLLSYAPLRHLRRDFKDRLIPDILGQYGFSYDQKARRVELADYAEILPSYTKRSLADHFWGDRGGIGMSVAELVLKRKSGKHSHTVFDGLLCRFDYPKKAAVPVVVKADGGSFGQFFDGIFSGGKRVKLEDPVFEGRFDVYSKDQIAARYILTPTVMQRLVDLEREHHGLQAIFRDDEVLLAIPDGTDLFHPGSFLSPIDRGILRQFHRDMTGVFEFIDALKLDAQSRI